MNNPHFRLLDGEYRIVGRNHPTELQKFNVLQRLQKSSGLDFSPDRWIDVEIEEVPMWAVAQICYLGSTDWRSDLMKRYGF